MIETRMNSYASSFEDVPNRKKLDSQQIYINVKFPTFISLTGCAGAMQVALI